MSINIILDNYQNVCYPGQTLSGRLECNFDQEEKLRSIRIHFKGSAKTEWKIRRASNKSSRTIRFWAEEDYFNESYNLLGGGDELTLPSGKHVYPFAYILPPVLPSSCNLAYGHVHYKITGTVDRPWKFDYETEFYLNLVSVLDLNYLPALREPRSFSTDKQIGCCCFQTGPVNFNMSLPVTGFVTGQEVNIGCHVQNLSNTSITKVRYIITAMLEFIAHSPSVRTKHSDDRVFKFEDSGIGAHGEKSWTTNFKIPSYPFLNLLNCGIIKVSYILQVDVVLPFPHANLSVELPITIGTIPLTGLSTSYLNPPVVQQPQPQYPDGYQMPQILNPTAPLMKQPTAPYPTEGAATPLLAGNINGLPTYVEVTKEKM